METPELDKMKAVHEKSQAIGEFLEWLHSKGINLAKYPDNSDYLSIYRYSTEKILAEFFGIDLDKCEKERRQLLEVCHNVNTATTNNKKEKRPCTV